MNRHLPRRPVGLISAPTADSCTAATRMLFDHLVGADEHCGWQVEAERLRSFEINDELQFGRKLHREVGDGSALQYLVDISRGATEAVTKINSIAYEPAGFHVFAITVHSGQACSRGASSDPRSFQNQEIGL